MFPPLSLCHFPLALSTDAQLQRQRSAEAAAGFNLKLQQLQERLQQEQHARSAELLQQRQQHEQQMHGLQRLLAEAEEQMERQRRELSAGFLLQAQQLEAKHAAGAADARAEAATAAALAEARGAEVAAAQQQLATQLARAEVRAGWLTGCNGMRQQWNSTLAFGLVQDLAVPSSLSMSRPYADTCVVTCRRRSCKSVRLRLP